MSAIPGRLKIASASWIFIAASVFLIAEFILVGYGPRDAATAQLEGVLGALSCVSWVAGFAVLVDWIVFDTFSVWGFSRRALCGATLKLIAAVIFNIQPWSLLLDGDNPQLVPNFGVPWSDFLGISFFHLGNCIDAIGVVSLFDRRRLFQHSNWPVWGTWTYCMATWFLILTNAVGYFDGRSGSPNPSWWAPCQVIGASLLLAGSIIYAAWAHLPPKDKMPLTDVLVQ